MVASEGVVQLTRVEKRFSFNAARLTQLEKMEQDPNDADLISPTNDGFEKDFNGNLIEPNKFDSDLKSFENRSRATTVTSQHLHQKAFKYSNSDNPASDPDNPNLAGYNNDKSRAACCQCCSKRFSKFPLWIISCLVLALYFVFFGGALAYSWVYVLSDPLCDAQQALCNMQLVGCVMIILSVVVFCANFVMHLINFRVPNIQRQYLRIQLLVPVLCAQSWLFMFASGEAFVTYSVFAEAYKTFSLFCVLHLFMNYFWEQCQGHQVLPTRLPIAQVVGLQFFVRPIKSVREFYITTIVGAIQCVLVRPAAFLTIILLHIYYPDSSYMFYLSKGINIIQWTSQTYAIYAVLLWARNFREDYSPLMPLVKHFGLMLFHILLPTLMPQINEILIHYGVVDLEKFFDGTDKQNLEFKVQGFLQSCASFLGVFYLSWMYSSRDVKFFSNENSTAKLPVTLALSNLLSARDIVYDFNLMQCSCCAPEDESKVFTSTIVSDDNEQMNGRRNDSNTVVCAISSPLASPHEYVNDGASFEVDEIVVGHREPEVEVVSHGSLSSSGDDRVETISQIEDPSDLSKQELNTSSIVQSDLEETTSSSSPRPSVVVGPVEL